MAMSLAQKLVAAATLVLIDAVLFLFSPLLGFVALFVLLPGLFAIRRL